MINTRRALILLSVFVLFSAGCRTETSVDVSSTPAVAAQPDDSGTTDQDETDQDPPPADTPAPPPTAEPTPQPVEAPTPPPTAEPAGAPTPDDDGDDVNVDTLSSLLFGPRGFDAGLSQDELACAGDRLSQDTGLLQRSTTTPDFDDLSIDDQTALILLAFDCAPDAVAAEFSQSFDQADTGGIDIPDEVGECLVQRLAEDRPDRRSIIVGFLALSNDEPVPDDSQTPVVDTMVECFPGSIFADAVTQAALEDPSMAGALDADCISTTLDGEAMRPFWVALVQNPGADLDFDSLPPETVSPLLDAIFACISFGQIIAGQAALTGVILSDSTVECIDEAVAGLDLTALLQSGEGTQELTVAMITCLTPEELAAIGG